MMTPKQIELARHALGLTYGSKVACRNYFVASKLHDDYDNWLDMVKNDYATVRKNHFINPEMDCFNLTLKGAKFALSKGEKLCKEDFPNQ